VAGAIADQIAAGAGCPPQADPVNVVCDHFFLTVNVAPSYWDTHTGGARIAIDWSATGDTDDDFDMYIYQGGSLVDQSAAGGTTSEAVFLEDASGTYEVRVVPFLVTNARADGVATFESVDGGRPPNPSRTDGGLGFGPSTVADLQRTEGEPLNFIHPGPAGPGNSAHWESGPFGTTTQQSWIHRSVDNGDQFNVVSPVGLRPNPPPGGGDTDVVVDDQGVAYWTDLEALVNLDCSVSNDSGNSWRKTSACVPTPGVDRQWFALDNGTDHTQRSGRGRRQHRVHRLPRGCRGSAYLLDAGVHRSTGSSWGPRVLGLVSDTHPGRARRDVRPSPLRPRRSVPVLPMQLRRPP
jgi:hypothetical protein